MIRPGGGILKTFLLWPEHYVLGGPDAKRAELPLDLGCHAGIGGNCRNPPPAVLLNSQVDRCCSAPTYGPHNYRTDLGALTAWNHHVGLPPAIPPLPAGVQRRLPRGGRRRGATRRDGEALRRFTFSVGNRFRGPNALASASAAIRLTERRNVGFEPPSTSLKASSAVWTVYVSSPICVMPTMAESAPTASAIFGRSVRTISTAGCESQGQTTNTSDSVERESGGIIRTSTASPSWTNNSSSTLIFDLHLRGRREHMRRYSTSPRVMYATMRVHAMKAVIAPALRAWANQGTQRSDCPVPGSAVGLPGYPATGYPDVHRDRLPATGYRLPAAAGAFGRLILCGSSGSIPGWGGRCRRSPPAGRARRRRGGRRCPSPPRGRPSSW